MGGIRIKPPSGKSLKPSASIKPSEPTKPIKIYPKVRIAEVDARDIRLERSKGSSPSIVPTPVEDPLSPLPSPSFTEVAVPDQKRGDLTGKTEESLPVPNPPPTGNGLGWDAIGNGGSGVVPSEKMEAEPGIAWFPEPALPVTPKSVPEDKLQRVVGPSKTEPNKEIGFDSFGSAKLAPIQKPLGRHSGEAPQSDLREATGSTSRKGEDVGHANVNLPANSGDESATELAEFGEQSAEPGTDSATSTNPRSQSHLIEPDLPRDKPQSTELQSVDPKTETPVMVVESEGFVTAQSTPGRPGDSKHIAVEQKSSKADTAPPTTPADGTVVRPLRVSLGDVSKGVEDREKGKDPKQPGKRDANGSERLVKRKDPRPKVTPGYQARLVPEPDADVSTWVMVDGFRISKELDEYLALIEKVTGRGLPPEQSNAFFQEVTLKEFRRLGKDALASHTRAFTKEVKNKAIEEWERQTRQTWPRYEEDVFHRGKLHRKAGDPFDAHHLIHKKYGGSHSWYNLTPASSPAQHLSQIHGAAVSKELYK